jgi:hypothetical protein
MMRPTVPTSGIGCSAGWSVVVGINSWGSADGVGVGIGGWVGSGDVEEDESVVVGNSLVGATVAGAASWRIRSLYEDGSGWIGDELMIDPAIALNSKSPKSNVSHLATDGLCDHIE